MLFRRAAPLPCLAESGGRRRAKRPPWRRAPLRPRITLVACLAVLAGCGFHPRYGNYGSAAYDERLAAIKVQPIPDRIGQMLANYLRDSFNPGDVSVPQRYTLTVSMSSGYQDLVLRNDGTPSRRQFNANAHFVLTPVDPKLPSFQGNSQLVDSYDVGEDPFTTVSEDRNEWSRAATQMGEDIRDQIVAFLERQHAGG